MTSYEERGGLAVADRDATLVAQLRGRETVAAEELVGAYGDRVYRLAIRITGCPSDAEEVTQDALWTASRKIDSFRGAAAFGSWLYRITANAAYQKLMNDLPSRRRDRVRSAQRLSLQFRDANCAYFASRAGTIARVDAGQCQLRLTSARAIELEEGN